MAPMIEELLRKIAIIPIFTDLINIGFKIDIFIQLCLLFQKFVFSKVKLIEIWKCYYRLTKLGPKHAESF